MCVLLVSVSDSPDIAHSVCVVCSSDFETFVCVHTVPNREVLQSHTNALTSVSVYAYQGYIEVRGTVICVIK